jgi:hypothetical protein
MPAKVFEYLAARRPLLAVVPPGEVSELLGPFPRARCFVPSDVDGLARFLAADVEGADPGADEPTPDDATARYARDRQAGELAGLLDGLVA